MEKFKAGDKVLVEAEVDSENSLKYYNIVITCDGSRMIAWANDENTHPADAIIRAHEDGMAKAWETARKLYASERDGGLSWDDIRKIFVVNDFYEILDNFTAAEAAEKIKAWEEGKKFHVGDVVRHHGKECVVTKIFDSDPEKCYLLWEDGGTGTGAFSKFEKTGRTIDIAGILAEIGGADAV